MKKKLILLLLIFTHIICAAQFRKKSIVLPAIAPQDTISPKIVMRYLTNDTVEFSTTLRPLRQVAGAPPAFYSYFWEFGDGTFSDASQIEGERPKHRYKESGLYQVRLFATNNHDDGIAPPSIPQTFNVQVKAAVKANPAVNFFNNKDGNIKLQINRNPKPGEDMVAYIGYRNKELENFKGSLVMFFNERQFDSKSFQLAEKRMYNHEENSNLNRLITRTRHQETTNVDLLAHINDRDRTGVGNTLHTADEPNDANYFLHESVTMLQGLKSNYIEHTVIHFDSLPTNMERFVFLTMKTLPEMIQDTNTVITMTAMLVPDNPFLRPEKFELEMQVVASHDPNRMLLKQHHINYRFMGKKKELTYKVQFQNTGKGPSRNISIGIALPRQLNAASLQLKDMHPSTVWCDSALHSNQSCMDTIRTADSIYILFKNIYLPGLQQNLVKNKDSTMGFVEYTIRFKKRPKKIPFPSRAVIVFDKNKPIYTNKAVAKFVKGISPGIVAGYNVSMSNGNFSAKGPVQIGYVLAPYAPARPYFQLEVHAGFLQQEDSSGVDYKPPAQIPNPIPGFQFEVHRKEINLNKKRTVLQIVPLHFRYNLNNWMGVGLGMMAQIAISEQSKLTEKYFVSLYGNRVFDTVLTRTSSPKSRGNLWSESKIATFVDVQVGRIRTGPTIGLRYLRQWRGNIPNQFFVYAGMKL